MQKMNFSTLDSLVRNLQTWEGRKKAKIWAVIKGLTTAKSYVKEHKAMLITLEGGITEKEPFYGRARTQEIAGNFNQAALNYDRAFMLKDASRCSINAGDPMQASRYKRVEKIFLPLDVNVPNPTDLCQFSD